MMPLASKPQSPLKRGYRAWNPLLHAYLSACDAALSRLAPRRDAASGAAIGASRRWRRILVANTAHLGDVILASAALPALRAAYPDAELGFLCGGWSRPLVEDHPLLSRVHTLDHWLQNRADAPLTRKIARYLRTRRRAIAEIRAAGYEAAIDLYSFYPNAADVLRAGGIPVRIGYTCGGFGALYTHPVEFRYRRGRHIAEYHADLLRILGVDEKRIAAMRPLIAAPSPAAARRGDAELAARGIAGEFVLMHVGCGDPRKAWPAAKWSAMARRLTALGIRVALAGRGADDRRTIAQIAAAGPGCADCCDAFDLPALAAAIGRARAIVAHDSAAAHLAAAAGTPAVVITPGIDPEFWRPMSGKTVSLVSPAPCSPCFRGCSAMECVREIPVERVAAALLRILNGSEADRIAPDPLRV
jgi:heptosyltransferase-3